MSEPLAILKASITPGFFSRRIARALWVTFLVVASLALAIGVAIMALVDFFLISWGLS